MVFQSYALYPNMSVGAEHRLRHGDARRAEARARQGGGGRRQDAADRASAEAPTEPALGRPAPARRHGPRAGASAARLPVRRAAVQSRRQVARRHAHRDQAAASADRHDDRLCHARSDRGDDARDQDRRAEGRRAAAGRHARRDLQHADQSVRRRFHGLAGDEPARGPRSRAPTERPRSCSSARTTSRSCCRRRRARTRASSPTAAR